MACTALHVVLVFFFCSPILGLSLLKPLLPKAGAERKASSAVGVEIISTGPDEDGVEMISTGPVVDGAGF